MMQHPPPLVTGSLWEIIANSSAFGLIVLVVLVLMSLATWAIMINRWRLFKAVRADTVKMQEALRRARSLTEMVNQAKSAKSSPLARIFLAGAEELAELKGSGAEAAGLGAGTVRKLTNDDFEIVEMAMERSLTDETAKLERGVVVLGTTASSAPFLGLLGTVVGIMDAFWGIGETGSASLAVVAPGIAEALLATIVGLAAAIPAVIGYNWANNTMKSLNDSAYSFILAVLAQAKKEET